MNEKDDIFLYSLDYANVTYYNKYQLNDDLQLCMNGKIENQIVEYNVSNNFSYEIVQMNIDVTYDYFTFWQIWVLVLVIVLCVGVGFYCWKKQRNQKQQKLYLLE
ncbi:unnamed protein product [Paramecium sonneborni]|uniref:Transmembrane protein n=1 Tax=Paramecium sonneborni TaxID=65129 RepID=A0A8S1R8D8_9CILI|nr:unnamed protein product [Paramecium sonneborni]